MLASSYATQKWIHSPLWDLFWIFSGLWLVLLFYGLSPLVSLTASSAILFLANRFVALSHSWSTTYMVLFSPVLKEARAKDRIRYFYWPLGITSCSFMLGYIVSQYQWFGEVGEIGWDLWIWFIYIGIYWFGHFWHFGNQDFGVLSFYRMRAGQSDSLSRSLDRKYASLMMFVIQPIIFLKVISWQDNPFSEFIHKMIPFSTASVEVLASPALVVAVIATIGMMVFELKKHSCSVPKLLYYLVMLFHPTFLYFASAGLGVLYTVSYLYSHWFVAIGLVSFINSNYFKKRRSFSPSKAWLSHFAILSVISLVVWGVTRPFEKYHLFEAGGLDVRVTLAEITVGSHWVVGFFLGFFLAEQWLHFYCDRVLFRFRDPVIRERVAPLMQNASAQ